MIKRLVQSLFCVCAASALLVVTGATRADDLDNIIFEGSVRDGGGAVIAGARVAARHVATGVEKSALAGDEGRFRIVVNEPGDYALAADAAGFSKQETKPLAVATGRRVAIDFTLSPSAIAEEMNVSASQAPLIDTTRTVAGYTITQAEIEALPIVDRDPLKLVLLLGGVAEAPLATSELAQEGAGRFFRSTPEEAGLVSLTGAPAASNNITIDGLDNNDDRAARERTALNAEAIAEVQVITNQYAAEYGRASGGRVNLRTRGGGNSYRGEAYIFFGDESLNANTFSRNARGLGRVPQQQLREGALFSGPVRASKEFFFASYERFDVSDYAEIIALVPVQANPLFPLPRPNHPPAGDALVALLHEEISTPEYRNLFNGRIDFALTSSHNVTLRFDLVRGENKRGFAGGTRLPETILIEGRDSDSASVSDNLVISNRAINQARFQFSRLLPRNRPNMASVGVVIEEPQRILAGAFTGSDSSPAFSREEKRAQFQERLSLDAGGHSIKAGADVQLLRSYYTDLFALGGQYTFDSVEAFLDNRPARFIQRFNTGSRLSNNIAGLFIQDEWKLRPNLMLSLGARWDGESLVDDRDNFSPRIAVAWDPFGGGPSERSRRRPRQGTTLVRAGFGMFYNRALLRTIDDFSLGRTTVALDSDIAPELLSAVSFPQPVSDQAIVARFGLAETSFLRRVDESLEIPYTIQAGLGVEKQLGGGAVVTGDYIFTRGAHLWRETNINAPVLPEGYLSFTEFLLSRDFDNRPNAAGIRPISRADADVVRFDLGSNTSSTRGAISVENMVRVMTLGLNAPRSSNIAAALNAIRFLRPDPSLTQVELLESSGNSFYHAGIFSCRFRLGARAQARAVYTLSKFIDEGTTNTASAQDLLDRRADRALSLQDQRHRFTLSGIFQLPLLKLDLAPVVSLGSSRPFNIGAGFDRNLNDIENDRPDLIADLERPVWRRPSSAARDDVKGALRLAPIGSSGSLPRNYGRGPATRAINVRASRTIAFGERVRVKPAIDVFNLFNNTVYSFGAEFINRDDADFLVPRRTARPRIVHLSLRLLF